MAAKIVDRVLNKTITGVLTKRGKKSVQHLDEVCANATEVSENLLMKLLRDNAQTEYGKKNGFADIHSIKEYQEKVPYSTYDDYAEYIERMIKEDAKDLITVYPIKHYAVSSGSVGNPKNIPVSQYTMDVYADFGINMTYVHLDEGYKMLGKKNRGIGHGLAAAEVKEEILPNGATRGAISGTTIAKVKNLLTYFLSSPKEVALPAYFMDMKYLQLRFALADADLNYMTGAFMTALVDLMVYLEKNWEVLVDDIEKGTISEDVDVPKEARSDLAKYLKADPKRAAELRKEFEKGFDTPIIPRIWKNLAIISGIGTGGFAAYTEKMKKYSGDIPFYFTVYAASEALMAVARNVNEGEFVLIPDSGFYEFIPVDAEDEKSYTMDQLEVGKDYEIIVTNMSGFYRYKIKDVIRVTGYHGQSPKLKFVYRKNQMISIAGEKTNDECVAWAVGEFAKEAGCSVSEYSIYANTDDNPGNYVVFMEPDRIMPKDKMETYREIIERKLSEGNPSFGAKIKTGVLGKTQLNFVQAETYALYRELQYRKGVSPNQLKPVRVIDNMVKERFFFGLIEKDG